MATYGPKTFNAMRDLAGDDGWASPNTPGEWTNGLYMSGGGGVVKGW